MPNRSFCDTHYARTCGPDISRTAWSYVKTRISVHSYGPCECTDIRVFTVAPSRSRDIGATSFPPSRAAVTAVTAGAPWRFERPILRYNGRVLGLGHQVPYTHYLP